MPVKASGARGSIENESQTIGVDPDHGGVRNFPKDVHSNG